MLYMIKFDDNSSDRFSLYVDFTELPSNQDFKEFLNDMFTKGRISKYQYDASMFWLISQDNEKFNRCPYIYNNEFVLQQLPFTTVDNKIKTNVQHRIDADGMFCVKLSDKVIKLLGGKTKELTALGCLDVFIDFKDGFDLKFNCSRKDANLVLTKLNDYIKKLEWDNLVK